MCAQRVYASVVELHLSAAEAEIGFHEGMLKRLDFDSVEHEEYVASFSSRIYCAEDTVMLLRRLMKRDEVRINMSFEDAARYYTVMLKYDRLGFKSYKA